jgi:hypothetical protein
MNWSLSWNVTVAFDGLQNSIAGFVKVDAKQVTMRLDFGSGKSSPFEFLVLIMSACTTANCVSCGIHYLSSAFPAGCGNFSYRNNFRAAALLHFDSGKSTKHSAFKFSNLHILVTHVFFCEYMHASIWYLSILSQSV